MTALQVVDVLLALGLTLRLTRLIVADDVGLWWVRGPATLWAQRHDTGRNAFNVEVWMPRWRSKLVTGLSCPFCVGFWIGVLVMVSLWAVGGPGNAWEPWRWVAAAFTLNQVAGHIGARLGDVDTED